ncbi:MAG: DNA polymerase domain-containing protein [Acidimicrobiia bacterium]
MSDEAAIEVDGQSIRISSPGKVLFPEQGWTKLDVVEHFIGCASGALRAVFGRPSLLKRWPHGVGARPFFQKRVDESMGETVIVRFPSARPGRMFVPRTTSDIVKMVQLGCIDLNPWPVRAEDTDHPDEMRLDLDPTPGIPWADVRDVAQVCRGILDEVGLVSWPKTSGSRGIHIYVRIEPEWTFHEVRRAVLALAREAGRRSPKATTAWWKEERHGVFIDFNQTARDKTLASAYSVRPTGFVSVPFSWDELDDVEIEDFPLDRFRLRWEEVGDLLEVMDETPGRLDTLTEWVVRDEADGLGDAPWPPHYPKQPGEPPRVTPSRRRREDK